MIPEYLYMLTGLVTTSFGFTYARLWKYLIDHINKINQSYNRLI